MQLNEKLRLAHIRTLISELIDEAKAIIDDHGGMEAHFEHPTADDWLAQIRQCLGGDDDVVTVRPTGIVDTEDSSSNFTMLKYLKTLGYDDSEDIFLFNGYRSEEKKPKSQKKTEKFPCFRYMCN